MSTAPAEFDAATQRELQVFLEQEQAKARLQTSIHDFTGFVAWATRGALADRRSVCWDKCITYPGNSKFSRSEGECLVKYVRRPAPAMLTSQLRRALPRFIAVHCQEHRGEAGQSIDRIAPCSTQPVPSPSPPRQRAATE